MAIETGATAWVLASTALVMIMTPGVGLFYGGLVRKKNFINMITLSFVAFALVSIQWVLFGYSLAFGGDIGGFIGNLQYLGLNNVGMEPGPYSPVIPGLLYMVFQLVFATVTMAIVTSGFAERIKFSSYLVFALLWTTIVYDPLAHWVCAIDFAGGTVVHISSGFAALALALVIGKRVGYGKNMMEPANIPWSILGAALLWFGWFGFNSGSAVDANGLAAVAFVTTNTAAAAAAIAWMLVSWAHGGKPSSLGFVSGAVAGLVAITPGAGYVTPMAAIVIGAVAGVLCYGIMLWRQSKGVDESLDAWAIHGMGGLWGALATGIFAVAAINGKSGLLEGNMTQFIAQVVGAGAAVIYAFVITYILAVIVDKTFGLRVTEEEEYVGLDISQHGERC
jgi:Amt family ammonium transporter